MAILKKQWNKLLEGIKKGLTNKDACIYSGISESTLYAKLQNAKDEDNPVHKRDLDFLKLFEKATIEFKLTHHENIAKAGIEHWQASAWLLERKYKREYGRLEMTKEVNDEFNDKTDEQLRQELKTLENAYKEPNKKT